MVIPAQSISLDSYTDYFKLYRWKHFGSFILLHAYKCTPKKCTFLKWTLMHKTGRLWILCVSLYNSSSQNVIDQEQEKGAQSHHSHQDNTRSPSQSSKVRNKKGENMIKRNHFQLPSLLILLASSPEVKKPISLKGFNFCKWLTCWWNGRYRHNVSFLQALNRGNITGSNWKDSCK